MSPQSSLLSDAAHQNAAVKKIIHLTVARSMQNKSNRAEIALATTVYHDDSRYECHITWVEYSTTGTLILSKMAHESPRVTWNSLIQESLK